MKKKVDFESVLSLVDKAISPTYLNPTQEIVLREVWNGKTYTKMACDYNYDPEYIKTVGCNLWQTLSQAFDEQINKSNFVPFMRQRIDSSKEENRKTSIDNSSPQLLNSVSTQQFCNWATAPDIQHFVGRKQEIRTLAEWSNESGCRLIVVSGMTGSGKTTLVTEFANRVKAEFDYVIWFSLTQLPSLTKLLNKYLEIINLHPHAAPDSKPQELSFLLSEFIDCLRQRKILLVLDGLQCILEVSQNSISYKEKFEGYGQFLRSLISTNHQSLLITTSRIKPKLLEYYSNNQVKFLNLQGFDRQTTMSFLNMDHRTEVEKKEIICLSKKLQFNPQLLKIASNHLDFSAEHEAEHLIEELSLIEAIANLLELELSYLLNLDREIIYWLAISCSPLSLEELSRQTHNSQPRLKFSHSIKSLTERSLVLNNHNTYSLMPLMKTYLRRKLVTQALLAQKF